MNKPHPVSTPDAPGAIGPYSQAVVHNGLVYCSGQLALEPHTGALVGLHPDGSGDIPAQTRQVLTNLGAVLHAAGSDFEHVLKTTVYLRDMADFPAMNAVYAEFFPGNKPARATVAVAGLPRGVHVEIDCTATRRL
jgi:2-iminobutanoate/2-iminopropanoate deaminase